EVDPVTTARFALRNILDSAISFPINCGRRRGAASSLFRTCTIDGEDAMRLPRFNPGNISVRSGGGGGGGMPGGKMGCGAIVIVLIGALVFGIDPAQMMGTIESVQGPSQSQQQQAPSGASATEICEQNAYSLEACNAL